MARLRRPRPLPARSGRCAVVDVAELPPEIDLDDWWRKTLLDQMYALRPGERRGCHWVMSSQTLNLFRRMTDRHVGGYFLVPPMDPTAPEHLYGLPVHVDEEAVGATLRPIS